jgi:hypothetical protein
MGVNNEETGVEPEYKGSFDTSPSVTLFANKAIEDPASINP